MKLAEFTIPGNSGQPNKLAQPSGLSENLNKEGEKIGQVLATTAFDWMFYIAITLTVLYILWSGIQIITSQGDVDRLQSAKRRLFFAIIGLVVVMMSFLIVRVVITTFGGDSAQFSSPFGGLVQPSP